MSQRFSKLTRRAMRALSPGHTISELGIVFHRPPSGDGVFSVNIMVDRRRIHRVIGRESDGITRQQAEDFVSSARTDAMRERLDLPERRKTPLGFREAAHRYVVRLEEEAGRNIKAKKRQLEQHLIPFLGDKSLGQLSTLEVERFKKERRKAGAAPATINRELAVLSHLFGKAVEWGWLKALPSRIRRFPEANGRIVYLTQQQCADLERAAAEDQNENVHAFVTVALRTGMRHSEILAIRREHIHLDRLVIWIPKAKAGAREQPITTELGVFLDHRLPMLPPGCAWLFPSPGSRTGHAHTMRKAFRRSTQRAGLDPDQITPHVLRHTVVTHLIQAGVDLPTVQRISGHKTLAMIARYAHQNGPHLAAAMGRFERRMRTREG